jgi:hypothetical protein
MTVPILTDSLVVDDFQECRLPSGRLLVVKADQGHEEVEIQSAEGVVEIQITLTEAGPLVRLSGARIELAASDTVAVRCRRFEVETTEGTELNNRGEVKVTGDTMRMKTAGDIHMNGAFIRLNCKEES